MCHTLKHTFSFHLHLILKTNEMKEFFETATQISDYTTTCLFLLNVYEITIHHVFKLIDKILFGSKKNK